MAQKNNIRSIRFSDELAELIDRQMGRTFTEKFENLVIRCVWGLPAARLKNCVTIAPPRPRSWGTV